jgi:hypothetical protein
MRFECSRKATSVVELADVVVEIAYSGVSRAPTEFSIADAQELHPLPKAQASF